MKLIKPKFEINEQESGLNGIYKAIELAGRTCYKSENKITEESAKPFVDRMLKSGHGAMLEVGTVYLKSEPKQINGFGLKESRFKGNYEKNPYSKLKRSIENYYEYVTTNFRVIMQGDYDNWDDAYENDFNKNWLDDLQYLCEPTEFHEKRVCVRFTTDRGVSHELVRHRVFSFAQESTRYCSYNKDKFGNELTFIIPYWLPNVPEAFYATETSSDNKIPIIRYSKKTIIDDNDFAKAKILKSDINQSLFLESCKESEYSYLVMLSYGCTPQQARQVLPNALKTEINMCGFVSDWEHFFKLRDDSHAHPDMIALAKPLHEEFINRGYIGI